MRREGYQQAGPGGRGERAAALLASPVRRAIVEVLQRHPVEDDDPAGAGGLTAAQLAERVGLHVTTVRFHLDQLERAGLATSRFTTVFGVGRPRKVYTSTTPPAGADRETGSHMRLLAGLLTAAFASDATPDEAGRRWVQENVALQRSAPATTAGEWLTKLGRLLDVLQRWGYSPNLTTSECGRRCRIDLVDCPFMDLARLNPDVVCGIHHGLLVGVLDRLGEDRVDVTLEPFVDPGLCQAHISTRHPFRTTSEEPPRAS